MKTFLKLLRYLILVLIICLAISQLAPHLKDLSKLWELKDQIHYGWFLAAILSQVFQYIGDGWLSQVLLQVVNVHVNMKDTMKIASLNVFAAHILPVGEAGGLAAAYHFYKKLGVNGEKFIFLTVCWGIITNGILFLLLFLPIPFLEEFPISIKPRTIIITVISIMLIILSIYLTRKILLNKLEKAFGKHSWSQHFFGFIKNIKTYRKLIRSNPGKMLAAIMGGVIYYASNIATLALSFLMFGPIPPLGLIIFAYAASLLFGRITLAPAGIGAAEATLILVFLNSNIDPNITVAAVLVYRLLSFWLPIPAGSLAFYSLHKKASKVVLEKNL